MKLVGLCGSNLAADADWSTESQLTASGLELEKSAHRHVVGLLSAVTAIDQITPRAAIDLDAAAT